MWETLSGFDGGRLERSCSPRRDRIRFGPSAPGIERAEVFLSACAFTLHRHDTYAVGVTTAGVQKFHYRGAQRICLPRQIHILHPDEVHDGAPGTEAGFGYRILYLAPALIQGALDGRDLPFVADPVQPPTPATRLVAALLADIDAPISDLGRVEIATTIADVLVALSRRQPGRRTRIDMRAVERVRDYLAAHADKQTPASVLERIAGTDRFTIARHFRRAFGTSPDRYRTMRRLALARAAIERGHPPADAAAEAGFADQSHMTGQFKRAYGLTPARWAAVTSLSDASPGEAGGMKKKQRPAKAHPVPDAREAFLQGQLLGVQPFNAAGDLPGREAKVAKDGKVRPPKDR